MARKPDGDVPLLPMHRDGPPLYDDVTRSFPWDQTDYSIPGSWKDTKDCFEFQKCGVSTFHPPLSEDPHHLYNFVRRQLTIPPRLFVNITGWFEEKPHHSMNRSFKFTLDLTSTIVASPQAGDIGWNKVYVPERTDAEETHGENENNSLLGSESGCPEAEQSDLMGWCKEYCKGTTGAKEFTIRREIQGLDLKLLQDELQYYLRQSIPDLQKMEVVCSAPNDFITICSLHWINRLRMNAFVWWFCVLTQLWIITLPVVCFNLKSYQVVDSVWKVSRKVKDPNELSGIKKVYAQGRDEAKIADLWAPTMIHAARSRLNDEEVLTLKDLGRFLRRAQERLDTLRALGLEESANGPAENAPSER
ncbi:uncharacterized protein N7469_000092 [Penicillium citrinum]|uniref:Uncharacterized protein n=2 Tax=Penicillium TaxID=5073 RepID=A0A9W9TW79_PENCI|nr:uncharacterized protein N7469_000092 [Penicillium citrinum]KAJ5241765.1 hypothetical protein N7469_000092 [Penicillium citrinum]KAK5807509.1 hypothetical protein VI817_001767 [Penicillium citrinum]